MESQTIRLQSAETGHAGDPIRQRTRFGKVLRGTFRLFGSTMSRAHPGEQDDGLDALDLLGGWEGSAGRRRRKR